MQINLVIITVITYTFGQIALPGLGVPASYNNIKLAVNLPPPPAGATSSGGANLPPVQVTTVPVVTTTDVQPTAAPTQAPQATQPPQQPVPQPTMMPMPPPPAQPQTPPTQQVPSAPQKGPDGIFIPTKHVCRPSGRNFKLKPNFHIKAPQKIEHF